MKKLLSILFVLAFMVGCSKDDIFEEPVKPNLVIKDLIGIKLENIFVTDKVSMNVKLETAGTIRIKIKDIAGTLVSQEKIDVVAGDNILSVYTKSLPKSSYTIELCDINNTVLGSTVFVINE
jgi:hypothetical protein